MSGGGKSIPGWRQRGGGGSCSKSSRWRGEGGRERTRDRGQVKGIVFRLLGTGGLAWHRTAHPTSTLSGSLAQMGQIITLSPQGPSGGSQGGRGGPYFISIKHKFTHLLSVENKKHFFFLSPLYLTADSHTRAQHVTSHTRVQAHSSAPSHL